MLGYVSYISLLLINESLLLSFLFINKLVMKRIKFLFQTEEFCNQKTNLKNRNL
jgi:hypothetical protein